MTYDTKCTFTLGKNNKGDNPKRPDYRGELIDDQGRVWELSGWIRERRGDPTKKFISGKIKLKVPRGQGDQFTEGAPAEEQPKPAPPRDAASEFLG
jgi:hypothetical protein